jgi:hypothetical protein
VDDFLWTADNGLDSPIFQSFLAGYLEGGELGPGAAERSAETGERSRLKFPRRLGQVPT